MMDRSSLPCRIVTWLVILYSWSVMIRAMPLISNASLEASGLGDSGTPELTPSPSIILDIQQPTNMQVDDKIAPVEQHLLKEILSFLQDNFFLILVITGLLVIIFLIVCSAMILSHRRKVNAYYPCSYPAKMYVDEADKTGGAPIFSEVPEKTASSSVVEPTNKAKQLQEDIIMATKNLRSPTKSPWRENDKNISNPKSAEQKICVQDVKEREENSSLPEDKNFQENVKDEAEEKINSRTSQDMLPDCQLEKSDPPNLSSGNEQSPASLDDLDDIEVKTNQEASVLPFISEEKTAF